MTVLSPVQVAGYWIGAGGPPGRAAEWLAIAMGESSLDDQAVSPAGAIGVWQVMPFNASIGGGTVADLYDPAYNAKVTVIMSGGGANCAAWDSAYANIYASGRYAYLAWPEVGSADYNNYPAAAAALNGHVVPPVSGPPPPDQADTLPGTIAALQRIGGQQMPAVTAAVARLVPAAAGMYRRGWMP